MPTFVNLGYHLRSSAVGKWKRFLGFTKNTNLFNFYWVPEPRRKLCKDTHKYEFLQYSRFILAIKRERQSQREICRANIEKRITNLCKGKEIQLHHS